MTPDTIAELEKLEKLCREEGFTELADFFRAKGRNALPDLLAAAKENERLREALEMCAESLTFARDKLGMCGEGDGAARKADAPDDIGSLPALTAARRALEGETL